MQNGGRPCTYCTCICAHVPNSPDILMYNSINQSTDEKSNIRCLRFAGLCMREFQNIVAV